MEDVDLLEESSKRCRTAPPSPPLVPVFARRSVSPVHLVSPLSEHITLAIPVSHSTALRTPVTSVEPLVSLSTKLPSFKYLTQNKFKTALHSPQYPDTCINDTDWRVNLEVWIEKNFPEKFQNLKNLLRHDKPGFELLNDAIFLTELKEQLEHARPAQRTPQFTSRISKKMKRHPGLYLDDEEPSRWSQGSPKDDKLPFEANYTYSTHTPASSPMAEQISPKRWGGQHKLNNLTHTSDFIHTQNHKGPNHTYTIHHHNQSKRKCISCGSDQSPCWRPSWSTSAGQLCNSCGLRYKKTGARCIDPNCCRIPAKGEWTVMRSRGTTRITRADGSLGDVYACLHCNGEVEVKEK